MPNALNLVDQPVILVTTKVVPSVVIPFNTGSNSLAISTSTTGASSNIQILNFGTASPLCAVGIGVSSTMVFYPPASSVNAYVIASDVYAATISMEVEIGYALNIATATIDYYPYIALAVAPPGMNSFTILPETITSASFPRGSSYSIGTIKFSTQTITLNNPILGGTRLTIVSGFQTQGSGTLSQSPAALTFNFSGGVALY